MDDSQEKSNINFSDLISINKNPENHKDNSNNNELTKDDSEEHSGTQENAVIEETTNNEENKSEIKQFSFTKNLPQIIFGTSFMLLSLFSFALYLNTSSLKEYNSELLEENISLKSQKETLKAIYELANDDRNLLRSNIIKMKQDHALLVANLELQQAISDRQNNTIFSMTNLNNHSLKDKNFPAHLIKGIQEAEAEQVILNTRKKTEQMALTYDRENIILKKEILKAEYDYTDTKKRIENSEKFNSLIDK